MSSRSARLIFEAVEAMGIARGDVASDPEALLVGPFMTWTQFITLMGRVSARLEHDAERLREVGRHMARVPAFATLRRIAGDVVSLRMLLEICVYWIAPSNFPHVPLTMEFLTNERVRFTAEVPEPHAVDTAFFYIFEGIVAETPTYLGLAPARIETSVITARGVGTIFLMPPSPSVLHRARRFVRSVLQSRSTVSFLEQQRTELEAGYQALQRMSDEFHALLESLPDLVIIHRDAKILWVNRCAHRTLGYDTAAELVGRPLLELVEPSWRPIVGERMAIPAGARAAHDVTEGRLLRKDGEVIVVEVTPAQHVVFGGAPARLIVGRDVSERLRMQQRLVTADRLASVGMLAAGVAHEINNPLTYVLGNIELVARKLATLGESGREARESLAIAVEGGGRIRAIVRDLLTLARARSPQIGDSDVGAIDVEATMDATLLLAGAAITDRARVVREYAQVPHAAADARIGQVLLNLVVNAMEAMPEADAETNELRIRTFVDDSAHERRVVIEVSDSGPGIPVDLRRRIFDPFFTTKPVGSGTGLGLAISERIVAELGGDIGVTCPASGGSTFRVSLRAFEPPSENAESP